MKLGKGVCVCPLGTEARGLTFLTSVGFPSLSYQLALGQRLDHAKSLGDSGGSVRRACL